jgi:hypothetical protein
LLVLHSKTTVEVEVRVALKADHYPRAIDQLPQS